MAITITLAAKRLQFYIDAVLKSSITYTNIAQIFPLHTETYTYASGVRVLESEQWTVCIIVRDGTAEKIPLGNITGRPTWANSAAGFAIAEAAIYAAFP